MNNCEYVKNALKTESMDFLKIKNRLGSNKTIRLLHVAMGMATEAAEFLDAIKKYVFYGKPLDKVNLVEEIGDSLWYIAIALDEMNVDMETVQISNIEKLQKRYAGKFQERNAIHRDVYEEHITIDTLIEHDKNDRKTI